MSPETTIFRKFKKIAETRVIKTLKANILPLGTIHQPIIKP